MTEYSKNKEYGLSGKFPVKVGEQSVKNQRTYLASLAGPNGEEIQFHRRGSCCAYESENSPFGSALVDVYEVTYEGLKKPILVYISFYDLEKMYIPRGFTKRK
ncbi:MAG: 2-dehydro-3-deoxyphosphooctonate aldolase [Flavobacteriaceae bacterium]